MRWKQGVAILVSFSSAAAIMFAYRNCQVLLTVAYHGLPLLRLQRLEVLVCQLQPGLRERPQLVSRCERQPLVAVQQLRHRPQHGTHAFET